MSLGQDRNRGLGRGAGDQRIDVELVDVTEAPQLRLREEGCPFERLPPFTGIPDVLVAAVSLENVLERRTELVVRVETIPEQRERAAGTEHAVDLAKRLVAPEPVEGLGDGDEIGRRVTERDVFGRPVHDVGSDVARKLSTHRGDRLDREHVRPGRCKRTRELAGSRGEVDDCGARRDSRSLDQPRDGVGRIPGAGPFVGLGAAGETDAREPMDSHAHNLQEMEGVRIDKWLWAARFFKTRGAATEAVIGGRVHVNGARAKPAKEVHVGDTIEVTIRALRRTVHVRRLSDKRGPASVASTLYEETPESVRARERDALDRRLARPLGADLGERPTKQDRRRLEALRRAERRRR